jgi:hypothetical protein
MRQNHPQRSPTTLSSCFDCITLSQIPFFRFKSNYEIGFCQNACAEKQFNFSAQAVFSAQEQLFRVALRVLKIVL